MAATQLSGGALRDAGVRTGDVVGVLMHNSDVFLEIMHAISHLGAIFMPINWRLAGPEIAYILDHAGASVLVTEPEFEPQIAAVRKLACRVLSEDFGDLRAVAEPEVDAVRTKLATYTA